MHITLTPLSTKHWPPFLHILIVAGQKAIDDGAAVVVGTAVVATVVPDTAISHKLPKKLIN